MTTRPILSRFTRLRAAFRGSRTERSYNLANVFLACCMAAEAGERGLVAKAVAEHVGMSVNNARTLLTRLVSLDLLTVKYFPSAKGGRPGARFFSKEQLFLLLGVEPCPATNTNTTSRA